VRDWKGCERKIASMLGGKRVPVSGRGRGDSPDIQHDLLSIEVKSRKKLPTWIEDAMTQAKSCARGDQLPLVVLHQDSKRYQDALVVTRLKYLVLQGDER
jgi:hypothetical protein